MDITLKSSAHPILCIGEDVSRSEPVADAIQLAGCEPLTVDDWNEAMARFYVDRRIKAVVLDYRGKEGLGMCLAQALRSLRADIPVVLVSGKDIAVAPKGIDACVCLGESAVELVPVLQAMLKLETGRNSA